MESIPMPEDREKSLRYTTPVFVLIGVTFFLLYLATLCPDWGSVCPYNTWDGLEYTICSSMGGIDHPPGHPLYLILTRVFCMLIPWLPLPYKMNIFSALFGALDVSMVYLLTKCALSGIYRSERPVVHTLMAVAAALIFGLSKVFWSQALITGVRTFFLFLLEGTIYFALLVMTERGRKWLWWLGLLMGLMLGTSILNALTVIVPTLLILLFTCYRRFTLKDWAILPVMFLPMLASYSYYPLTLASHAVFIHPTSVMSQYPMGSLPWYLVFISGSAWFGQDFCKREIFHSMVSLFQNNIFENFPSCSLLLFLTALFTVIGQLLAHFLPERSNTPESLPLHSRDVRVAMLLFSVFVCVSFPLLFRIGIAEQNGGSSFYIPTFLLYLLIVALGAAQALEYILECHPALTWSRRAGRTLIAGLLIIVFTLPVTLFLRNYPLMNLRTSGSFYEASLRIVRALPPDSLIYSSLIFYQLIPYFSRYDPVVKEKHLQVKSPDLAVMGRINKESSPSAKALQKSNLLEEDIEHELREKKQVLIGSDSINEDKYPELLLMGNAVIEPCLTREFFKGMTVISKDALPYRVVGFRKAVICETMPKGVFRGIANDGDYDHVLKFLGYALPPQRAQGVYRKRLTFHFYWKALKKPDLDYMGTLILLDSRYNKVSPEKTTNFFRIGGKYPASQWKPGDIIRDEVFYYPPSGQKGRYFLALRVTMNDGVGLLRYIPTPGHAGKKSFDFMLLLPLVL